MRMPKKGPKENAESQRRQKTHPTVENQDAEIMQMLQGGFR